MKKTRFIPYGYTIRNGHTVIDHKEAEIIQEIFQEYIKGASLKCIADDLTLRRVPYTEKTDIWDKARIGRIIDNAKYIGEEDYDPIVDEETFARAMECKVARIRNTTAQECEAINILRDQVRCGCCGAPMVRRICSKRQIKESWVCTNEQCRFRVRIRDKDLIFKVTLLMNRIIENAELMIPKPKQKRHDSPVVQKLQQDIEKELDRDYPSEDFIISCVESIATQLYKETSAKEAITAQIARKRALLMRPQEEFNSDYFTDLIAFISLGEQGHVTLHTKTETEVSEDE